MKVDTAILHKYARMAASALEKRPTRSEHGGIRVRAEEDGLSLYGTNGELFMISRCPIVEAGDPFDVLIDPRLLLALTASKDGVTELTMDLTSLSVVSGPESAVLPTEAADYYPAVEQRECSTPFPLSRREIDALAIAAQPKSNLPRDSSIHVTTEQCQTVCTTTTAGFRHACISFDNTDYDMHALIPLEPLLSCMKAIGDDAQISLGDDMVMVAGGMATARFPTNQGPILRGTLLFRESEFYIDVPDVGEITSILSKIVLFSDSTRGVVLDYDGETVSIMNKGGIEYQAVTTMKPHRDEPFRVYYNVEYLLGAFIASGSGLQMSMVSAGEQYPFVCKITRSANEIHLIVPLMERTT